MKIQGKVKIFNLETKMSQKGDEYTTFTSSFSEKKGEEFINGNLNSVAFGYTSEKFEGAQEKDDFFISGELKPNNYENKKGEKVYGFKIIVFEAYKLEKMTFNDMHKDEINVIDDNELPF